jgi:hypothetical protein
VLNSRLPAVFIEVARSQKANTLDWLAQFYLHRAMRKANALDWLAQFYLSSGDMEGESRGYHGKHTVLSWKSHFPRKVKP